MLSYDFVTIEQHIRESSLHTTAPCSTEGYEIFGGKFCQIWPSTIESGHHLGGSGHQPMRELVASICGLFLKGTVPDSTVIDE